MRERDLVFVDTETTGIFLDKELLEIGAVRVNSKTLEVIATTDIKIKPSKLESADPEALRVIGFDEEEWNKEGISLMEGMRKFLDFAREGMLVGHNLAFDWMHIQNGIETCDLEPTYFYKGLDIFSMAWLKFGKTKHLEKMSLKEMAEFFDIKIERHHRAIDDALATYHIYMELVSL